MSIHWSQRIPHVLVVGYMVLFGYACVWYMGLKDPTATQLGFITALTAVAPAFFALFSNYVGVLHENTSDKPYDTRGAGSSIDSMRGM